MKTQAENLTFEEKLKIADYLTKGDANENGEELVYCSKKLDADDLEEGSQWTSWGHDPSNSRNQASSTINSSNIDKLKLKWSFGLRTNNPRAQPIAVGSVIFISAGDTTYALNKNIRLCSLDFYIRGSFKKFSSLRHQHERFHLFD